MFPCFLGLLERQVDDFRRIGGDEPMFLVSKFLIRRIKRREFSLKSTKIKKFRQPLRSFILHSSLLLLKAIGWLWKRKKKILYCRVKKQEQFLWSSCLSLGSYQKKNILESPWKNLTFQPLDTLRSSMRNLHLIDHWEPFHSMTQNSISTRTFSTLFYWKWTEIKMRKVNYTQSKLFFIVVLPRFPEKAAPRPTSTFKHFI